MARLVKPWPGIVDVEPMPESRRRARRVRHPLDHVTGERAR